LLVSVRRIFVDTNPATFAPQQLRHGLRIKILEVVVVNQARLAYVLPNAISQKKLVDVGRLHGGGQVAVSQGLQIGERARYPPHMPASMRSV
jgi:hypothetical protein